MSDEMEICPYKLKRLGALSNHAESIVELRRAINLVGLVAQDHEKGHTLSDRVGKKFSCERTLRRLFMRCSPFVLGQKVARGSSSEASGAAHHDDSSCCSIFVDRKGCATSSTVQLG
jgi:hypothetical protein